jgi:hypothetical protein
LHHFPNAIGILLSEGEAQRFHDLQQQRNAIMFKDMKKTLHPCPNPQCSSKVFCTEANLNKHFGAKPECAVYAREMCAALLKEAVLAEQKLFTPAETVTFQPTQILLPGIPTPNINMENMGHG